MTMEIRSSRIRVVTLLLTAVCLITGIPNADAQTYDPNTTVYIDALWCRTHAADCPYLILKEQKQTMTLAEADLAGYRIGESGQSGRTDCCLVGYQRQHPLAVIEEDAKGVVQTMSDGDHKYHVHGCHRFTPDQEDQRLTLANARSEQGFYLCEHCEERGPGFAQMTQEEWDKLPSSAPWVPPVGWAPSPFSADTLPPQEEIDILLSEALHGHIAIQERTFINPVATVDNFLIMRFFFPVGRWLELYQAYRCTGDTNVLEQLRGSARNYNAISTNYLSAAQKKAEDPEGMAYMYTMAASAKITLQLALKYPGQVTAGEIAEAEDFLMTIISVLQPVCEGNDNLDPQMGIPQPLADDFRTRAFNRALNGIGTIGMATAALEDLQVLNSTTAYQSTIDRYRKVIQEYIKNWKSTGFEETLDGEDYFSYPYSAGDSGYMDGDVKLFSADDQGHFTHSMQGVYWLYESVPELGIDDAFMTAIANTIYFNSYTETSGSPQTPSQEAIRPYSRYPYGAARERFYMLEAFKDGVIAGQCCTLSASATEAANSEYEKRRATLNAHYLKALRQDRTLIHLADESALVIWADDDAGLFVGQPIPLHSDVSNSNLLDNLDSVLWEQVSGPGEASFSDVSALEPSVTFSESGTYMLRLTLSDGDTTNSATTTITIEDTSPPAPPTGLVAVVSEGYITLNWEDNTEADFASYLLYRSETSGSYNEARASGLLSNSFVDHGVVNGRTYFYRVVAQDINRNASEPGAEVSAVAASTAQTVFGSEFDGFDGYTTSPSTGTEARSLTADSVNYAFGTVGVDEAHTASLLKSFTLDRSGGSYTIEGVVDFTDGYGDDNNRIGILLFNDTDSQTADGGGGLYLRLNTDGIGLAITDGINNGNGITSGLPTTSASGAYSGDSWVGTMLKYTADIVFSNNLIDVAFTFTDQDGVEDTLSAQVVAANYPGTYFGFATKLRNRGSSSSNRDVPPVLDYRSFSVTENSAPEGYALWASGWGTDIGDSSHDFEPDGMANWLEYALGGDPTADDAADSMPVASMGSDGEGSWLYYTYNRRADDPDLTYTVWAGTNLVDGLDVEVPAWSVSPATNGVETATHRMPTDTEPTGFMKLEIELAE